MNTNKTELNMNELKMVNGGGVITGFNGYVLPNPRQKKGETGTEQNK